MRITHCRDNRKRYTPRPYNSDLTVLAQGCGRERSPPPAGAAGTVDLRVPDLPLTMRFMTRCEVCGNDYELAFTVETRDGARHVFDSFACAIHRMAPICEHCRVQIIGQGVEVDGHWFCGAHCARAEGKVGIVDKVGSAV